MSTLQVRDAVFETNSSSTHSLTMGKNEVFDLSFPKDMLRAREITVELGEYGWGWRRYYDPLNKLSYLLTQLDDSPEQSAKVVRAVEMATGCSVKIVKPDFHYVDHQSDKVGRRLANSPKDLKAFLFSSEAYLQTGNDNSDCGEFIPTDRGEEPFHEYRYADLPNHEGRYTLEFSQWFDEVGFSNGDFELSGRIEDLKFNLRYALQDALAGSVCVGGEVSAKSGRSRFAHHNAGRDLVLRWMAGMTRTKDPTDAPVKLLRSAEISLPDDAKVRPLSAFDVCDDPYSARFKLEFAASDETIEAVKQAVLDICSGNNETPKP